MTTIGMQYDVLPGKEQFFIDAFSNVLGALKATPGHVESHLYEDVQNRGSFLISSQWETKEAFAAFIQSQAFKDVTNWGKEQILKGRPKHKVYRED